MLSKVLGIMIAGVFIGAAAVEISGYWARLRARRKHGPETPPEAVDPENEVTPKQDPKETRTEG